MTLNAPIFRRHRSGFTLIEMVISAALMALILVSAYLCLSAGFAAQKMVAPRTEIIQNARVAMAIMSADLRAACPLSKDDDLLGMTRTIGDTEADNLDFATHNYTPQRAREGDFCQESFYVDKDPETGRFALWRRRNPVIALDPLNGGSREEIAQGIVGLKFEYFDGTDWYDTWGEIKEQDHAENSSSAENNLSGLPSAVRITLFMDSEPDKKNAKKNTDAVTDEASPAPPLVFQTVVCLNLAETSQNNSSGDNNDTGTPSATGNGGMN